ncbi:MAG TPA: glycosyltransferase [Acidimicrobiales bacterium]|jgi:undecaprenyldiphospho-muramoylpentapeptide beta-N-acetylglucosaminyltransferase
MTQRRSAVIAGGGTAGHAFVALAVARALVERGVAAEEIQLIGSARGLDRTLLGRERYALTLLAGRGVLRRLNARAVAANLAALGGLAWAGVRALLLLAHRRPRVVVSVGGYASVPVGLAAVALRIPLVLVNIDAVPGAAHRLLGRFAAASAVAFEGTNLPRSKVTGAPVRPDLRGVERSPEGMADACRTLHIPADRRVVGVVGGSLGAGRLNEATLSMAGLERDRADLAIDHVAGARNLEQVRAARDDAGLAPNGDVRGLSYRLVGFEEDMASFYESADLVVCRSGALTVAEVALAGVPAILVPLPGAPGDHQSANAAALVDAGAALMLRDEDCDGARLAALVDGLLADPARLAAMGIAASALGRPDAADAVAALVLAHAR